MENSPLVLVVDDRRDIREPQARYLERHAVRVTPADDSAAARRASQAAEVDLVVRAIEMPGEVCLALCRHLRETARIPFILLTAMAKGTVRIAGLEISVDGCVTQPFKPRELLARINAVIRHTQGLPAGWKPRSAWSYGFDRRSPDTAGRELVDEAGVLGPLSTGKFLLHTALPGRGGIGLGRDQIPDLTGGRRAASFDRVVDNQVSRLRQERELDPANPRLIATVRDGNDRGTCKVERE